jgi:hypothetical protein
MVFSNSLKDPESNKALNPVGFIRKKSIEVVSFDLFNQKDISEMKSETILRCIKIIIIYKEVDGNVPSTDKKYN